MRKRLANTVTRAPSYVFPRHLRSAIGIGILGMLSVSAAHAQSSVTLYGIIDAGLTYVNNSGGNHVFKFDDGVSYTNRLGFKGTEDLGGGLKAVFTLESAFHVGSGTYLSAGTEFSRQAFVGLSSDHWGTVSFGNQYDMTEEFVYLYNISAFGSGYAIHQGDLDRMYGDSLPSSIKYMSADYNGLQFGGMWSFGNVAGNFHQNSAYSVGAHYTHGNFTAGTAYTRLNDPTFDPYAMIGTSTFLGTATTSVANGQITDLYSASGLTVDSQRIFGIGSSYTIGNVMLDADFTYTTIKGLGQSSHMRVFEGGASYNFTPSLVLYGGYQYTTFETNHWNQGALGLHYLLSQRTDVYVSGDYMRASNGVNAVIGYSFTPSTSNTQADVRIGMRHSF